ncbi:MAG: hypothetical protein EOM05_07235 [Clostridia bacterium]|nr:hypothetical protein [Clostridia bacterium]
MDNKKNEESHFKKVLLALGFFFLIFGSIFFLNCCQNQNEDYMDNSANLGRLEQKQTTDLNQQLFAVSINSKIYVDSTGQAVAYIKNDKTNSYNMQVNIKDDITGESLYQSETIKPGNELDSITIKNNLQVGKYDAIAEFFALDKDTKEVKGKVIVKVVLIVEV